MNQRTRDSSGTIPVNRAGVKVDPAGSVGAGVGIGQPDRGDHSTSGNRGQRRRRRRSRVLDICLGIVGIGLAGGSSFLPYYVYNNTAEFGPPEMQFTGRIEFGEPLIEDEEIAVEERKPLFQDVRQANADVQEIDPTVTGSIEIDESNLPTLRPAVRPRPSQDQLDAARGEPIVHETFVMVFATRGRALIRDGDDLLPVAIGSRLPDGSTVKSLSRRDGGWEMLTSENSLLQLSN